MAAKDNMILFDDWRFICAYPALSNDAKYITQESSSMGYFEKLPGFDPETFPFVVASSSKSVNLINVKDPYTEPLIVCE